MGARLSVGRYSLNSSTVRKADRRHVAVGPGVHVRPVVRNGLRHYRVVGYTISVQKVVQGKEEEQHAVESIFAHRLRFPSKTRLRAVVPVAGHIAELLRKRVRG